MKHCHISTVIYIIFKYFPFAAIPLLSGFISVLRSGSFFTRSIYYSMAVFFAVIVYAVMVWRNTVYKIDEDSFILQKGIFIKRKIVMPIKNIAFFAVSHELLSIFGAQRFSIDTIAGDKKHHDVRLLLSRRQSTKLLSVLSDGIEKKEIFRPSPLKIIILAATVSHWASGLLLLSPVLSALGKLLDMSLSQQLYGQADRIAKSYLSELPPIFGTAAIILLFGWIISFVVNSQRYSCMKIFYSSDIAAKQSGFLFPKKEILKKSSVAAVSIRQTLTGHLLGLGTVYLNAPGFAKGRNGGVLLPIQSKKELKKDNILLPRFETDGRSIFTERFAWYKLIMVPLSFALGIILLTLYISFIYKRSMGVTLLLGFVGLFLCGHQILFAMIEYKHCRISLDNDGISIISRRRNRLCSVRTQLCNASIMVKRTIFQRMDGTCTVTVCIQSEIPEHYKVRHVSFTNMIAVLQNPI